MVALNEIQELSRRIAEELHPDKIIFFGSCATALRAVPTLEVHEGSNDVGLLVILRLRAADSARPWRSSPEFHPTFRSTFSPGARTTARGDTPNLIRSFATPSTTARCFMNDAVSKSRYTIR